MADALLDGRVEIQPGTWLERSDLERLEDGTVTWTRFHAPDFSPREGDRIVLRQGTFHTMKGHKLDVSPTECRIDKKRFTGKDMDANGGPASIG